MNYLFYGNDFGRIQKEIKKITEEFQEDYDFITLDMRQIKMSDAVMELMSIPFFSSHKIIHFKNCEFLTSNTDEDTSLLEAFLRQPIKENTLIMSVQHDKCDGRKKIVKLIQKTCKVKALTDFKDVELRSYILNQLNEYDLQLSLNCQNLLIQRLPNDCALIDLQLEKLSCYPDPIDEEVICALIQKSLDENIFELSESILKGKFDRAFSVYKDMRFLNYDPIYFLAVLASQFRFYYQIKVGKMQSKSEQTMAAELKAHPYRVKLTCELVKNISADELLKLIDACARCDIKIKTGKMEKFLAFEMFLIECQGERL